MIIDNVFQNQKKNNHAVRLTRELDQNIINYSSSLSFKLPEQGKHQFNS